MFIFLFIYSFLGSFLRSSGLDSVHPLQGDMGSVPCQEIKMLHGVAKIKNGII